MGTGPGCQCQESRSLRSIRDEALELRKFDRAPLAHRGRRSRRPGRPTRDPEEAGYGRAEPDRRGDRSESVRRGGSNAGARALMFPILTSKGYGSSARRVMQTKSERDAVRRSARPGPSVGTDRIGGSRPPEGPIVDSTISRETEWLSLLGLARMCYLGPTRSGCLHPAAVSSPQASGVSVPPPSLEPRRPVVLSDGGIHQQERIETHSGHAF
jgi:hypothetical protein